MSRARNRRRRQIAVAVAIVAFFVVALVIWIGKGSGGGPAPRALPTSTATDQVPSLPVPSPSVTGSGTPVGLRGNLPLTPLPGDASTVNDGSFPARRVHMEITSDSTILRLGYLLKGGTPDRYYNQVVASPVSFDVIAHGFGLVAEIAAQAGPTASTITCTISVDGGPPVSHTVKGAYHFVACLD